MIITKVAPFRPIMLDLAEVGETYNLQGFVLNPEVRCIEARGVYVRLDVPLHERSGP